MVVSVDGTPYNEWSVNAPWFWTGNAANNSYPEPFGNDGPLDIASWSANGATCPGGAMTIRLDNKLDALNSMAK